MHGCALANEYDIVRNGGLGSIRRKTKTKDGRKLEDRVEHNHKGTVINVR